jgi:uncharacterized membrane protein YGL010W
MPTNPATRQTALRVVLLAGLVAGTLDILAAFTQFYIKTGKSPVIILNYIASALFGKTDAYGRGTPMIIAGLLLHYMIAFAFTLFFFWLYPKHGLLSKSRLLTALLYGLFVWAIMNLLVVPMSVIGKFPSDPTQAVIAAAILICMIGLPLSFIIGGYYDRRKE